MTGWRLDERVNSRMFFILDHPQQSLHVVLWMDVIDLDGSWLQRLLNMSTQTHCSSLLLACPFFGAVPFIKWNSSWSSLTFFYHIEIDFMCILSSFWPFLCWNYLIHICFLVLGTLTHYLKFGMSHMVFCPFHL